MDTGFTRERMGSVPTTANGPPHTSRQEAPSKLALLFFITVFAIGLALKIWLSTIEGSLSDQQNDLSESAEWLLKTGLGAVVGMLIGKRLA